MKKLLLMILAVAGYVGTANAEEPDIYLRSNIYQTPDNQYYGWDNNVEALKFTCEGDNPNNSNEAIYSYIIDATSIKSDINFRLYISGWDNTQLVPYKGETTEWDFSTYNSTSTYKINSWDDGFKNTTWIDNNQPYKDKYFTIKHTLVKAAQYKITLYRTKTVDGYIYMIIEVISMPVEISSFGMSTYCCNRALDFTNSGITAEVITGASNGILSTSAISKVPANTGIFLTGNQGIFNVEVIENSEAETISKNMLVGVTTNTNINQEVGSYTNYILTVNKADDDVDTPKFFKVNTAGNTVLAGKAYLQIPTADAARMSFWFNDGVSAIEGVEQASMDGPVYNVAGQRVAQPVKGLYIANGKKFIKK